MSIFDNIFNAGRDVAGDMRNAPAELSDVRDFFSADHPGLTGRLANIGYSLANMGPTGLTAGENISNVFRGIVGGRQEQMMNQIRRATLPYELQMPKAQLENIQAESAYRREQIPMEQERMRYEQSQEARNYAMSDWYNKRFQMPNSADLAMNLATSQAGVKGDPSTWTPDEAKRVDDIYTGIMHRQSVAQGGFEEQAYNQALKDNPGLTPTAFHQQWTAAGAQGPAGVHQPFQQEESFLNEQDQLFKQGLQKPMSQSEWSKMPANAINPAYLNPQTGDQAITKGYGDYTQGINDKNAALIQNFMNYRSGYKPGPGGINVPYNPNTNYPIYSPAGPSSGGFGASPYSNR